MNNQIKQLRERLSIYGDLIIDREQLEKLIHTFAPSYKVSDLTLKWLISPIKRGKSYINNYSNQEQDAYKIVDTYFEWVRYMIWGIQVYNSYALSTQSAEWYTVYNTRVSGKRIIWKNKFIFKKQVPSFFYGSKLVKQWNFSYSIMTPERALIQMIKDKNTPEYLPRSIDKKILRDMAKKYCSKNVINKIMKLCS